jgi:two-component system phosphate regulon response regulator PhoB
MTNKKIILCMADNLDVIKLVQLTLTRGGIDLDFRSVPRGRDGLDMARREKPALIFLDDHLSDMDDWEVLKHIRADGMLKDIRVIMHVRRGRIGDWPLTGPQSDAQLLKPFGPMS